MFMTMQPKNYTEETLIGKRLLGDTYWNHKNIGIVKC